MKRKIVYFLPHDFNINNISLNNLIINKEKIFLVDNIFDNYYLNNNIIITEYDQYILNNNILKKYNGHTLYNKLYISSNIINNNYKYSINNS